MGNDLAGNVMLDFRCWILDFRCWFEQGLISLL